MAGIAYIIQGANFASSGLGKVTQATSSVVALSSLSISGSTSVTENGTYSVIYSPSNTTQRGVTWSITSGSEYASIDQDGVVTAKSGANSSMVTIKATSIYDSSKTASKTISVTYKQPSTNPDSPELPDIGGGDDTPTTGIDYTGAYAFMPLTANSTPTLGNLSVNKENTTYSEDGAYFNASGKGLAYNIPSGKYVRAIAMTFKKLSTLNLTNSNYFLNCGSYTGSGSAMNGLYAYTSQNSNDLGVSAVPSSTFVDVPTGFNFSMDTEHRICFAIIGTLLYVYIDGVQVSEPLNYPDITRNKEYLVIGNAWRYRMNNGDRVFGGYIKDVAIWTDEVAVSDLNKFSRL